MSGFHNWSSIEQAWAATEQCPVESINDTVSAQAKGDNSWTLIKRESRVRLIVLDLKSSQQRIICKIYRNPYHLGWRTLGMVSRANREFTALMEAHREGLPVACPHSWQESRKLGCVIFSSISLQLIDGTNLEYLLSRESTPEEQRLQLAWQKGRLLRQLHKSGLQWGTAFPRNIMVQGANQSAKKQLEMKVIDTPYALWHRSDISCQSAALSDLRNAVQVKGSGVGFAKLERTQLMLGYCGDDMHDYARLLKLLKPRPRYAAKLERWRRRCTNMLVHSPRSKGFGGRYDVATGAYTNCTEAPDCN